MDTPESHEQSSLNEQEDRLLTMIEPVVRRIDALPRELDGTISLSSPEGQRVLHDLYAVYTLYYPTYDGKTESLQQGLRHGLRETYQQRTDKWFCDVLTSFGVHIPSPLPRALRDVSSGDHICMGRNLREGKIIAWHRPPLMSKEGDVILGGIFDAI